MRVLPRVLLLSVIVGVTILAFTHQDEFESMPFPRSQLYVNLPVTIRSDGEYYVKINMPVVGSPVGMATETIPCDFTYSVHKGETIEQSEQVQRITLDAEIGSEHVYEYRPDSTFHLSSGDYQVTITGGSQCVAATNRGASVTIDQDLIHPTEHYLLAILLQGLAKSLLIGGLIGLVVLEVRVSIKDKKLAANE